MSKRTAEEVGLGDDERSTKKQKLDDTVCPFDNLPIEALLTIFLWVPYEELANCAVVNKTWAHLLRQKELWKQKALQKFGSNVTEKKTDPLMAALTENGVIHDWRRYYLTRSLLTKVQADIFKLITDSGFKNPPVVFFGEDISESSLKTTSKLLAFPRFTISPESLELYLSYFIEFLKLYVDSRMPEKAMIHISKLIYDFVLFAWNSGSETDTKAIGIFAKFVSRVTSLCNYANEHNYGVSLLLSLFEICVVGRLVYPTALAEELIRAVLTLSAVNSSLDSEWKSFDENVDNRGGTEPGQNIRNVIEPLFQEDKMNEIANVLLKVVHEYSTHSDYRMRACALSALKTLGVNPQWLDDALSRVVEEILPLVTDPSNAVRAIAVDLLYVGFDTVLDSSIRAMTKPQLQNIIKMLISQIDVKSSTRMKCPLVLYTLLTKYSENRFDLLTEEDINAMGEKLLALLKYQIEKGEHVNDVLSAVSDMAGFMHNSFAKFYEPFVRLSEALLSSTMAKKSNVITTMTLLGASVGKDIFQKDVKKMLDDILGEQTMEIYQMDDFNKGYFLAHASPQIYECLLEEFDEYLPKIIPVLLDTTERAIDVHQEAMNLDGDDWGNEIPMPDNIQLTFERPDAEQADLKLDALATLIFLIKKLEGKFAPFVERTLTAFINVTAMRELPSDKNSVTMFSVMNTLSVLCDIYATTDVTLEKLREVYDQIIETLQGTFSDNIIDFEYYSVALQTIKECFARMKSKFEFTQDDMGELLDWLMEVVDLVDFNHDDHATGTDMANDQINTDREIDETLVAIIDLNKNAFLEAFKVHPFREWIMDRTIHAGIDDLSVHEQHNAVVFLDIIAEKFGDEVWEYVSPALGSITAKITTPDPYLRQSIVFAVGTLVQHFADKVEYLIPTFIEKLVGAFNFPDKAENNSLSATDNVISTLMKIYAIKPHSYDFKPILGLVLEWGPLREDFEESKYVHPVLLRSIVDNPKFVLDSDERVRLFIMYIIGLLSKPMFIKEEAMRQLLTSSWSLVRSEFSTAFNKTLNELNDMQKTMIEKSIEKGDWPASEEKSPKK